ncbi:hypothetical protein DYB37_006318 [Aphanomyces astaci]|uniref:UDENN domain-containing protein n=2 Tax=Aphanomyces astaci TaxID=112090 RepID=A0A418F5Q5_APHAT|nr:hypothetical protein DYB37_006318 [Aphanomyces astaci]
MQQVCIVLSHDHSDTSDKHRRDYKVWMPLQSSVSHVVTEAVAHWNDCSACTWKDGTWTIYDKDHNEVPRDFTLDYLHSQTLPYPDIPCNSTPQLHLTFCVPPKASPLLPTIAAHPLTPADQVLQIFLVHALQNPWGQGWRINWQQFKTLTKYTMLPSSTSSLGWDTQKMLAFKAYASCPLGLTYPEFLLALARLVNVEGTSSLDLPSLHTIILDSTATTTASLRSLFAHLQSYDYYAEANSSVSTLTPFSKSLHHLLASFRTPGAPSNVLTFSEFRAFVLAVRLKLTVHVTIQQLTAVFVHQFRIDVLRASDFSTPSPFHNVDVPISRLVTGLIHVGLCSVPRLIGLLPAAESSLNAQLAQRVVDPQYPVTCIKIVMQEITHALLPHDIDAICARLPARSAHSFREAAASLHRVFLSMFQCDGAIDYVAHCRALVSPKPRNQSQAPPVHPLTDQSSFNKPTIPAGSTNSHPCCGPPRQHPLDKADDLFDAIVVEAVEMTHLVDIEFVAAQWLTAIDLYERFIATQLTSGQDHCPVLLRYATTLTVFAQQLWPTRDVPDILELAIEAVRVAGLTFHAYWASLCLHLDPNDVTILTCVWQWARCLQLHGDFVSLQTSQMPDIHLHVLPANPRSSDKTIEFWSVTPVATAAMLYHEAWRRYLVAVTICPSDIYPLDILMTVWSTPGGEAAYELFHDALDRLASLEQSSPDSKALEDHIQALVFVRHSFLSPTVTTSPRVAPFYSYVVAALFQLFSTSTTGLSCADLNRLNAACSFPALPPTTLQWLHDTFESTGEGLTQAGLVQYFVHFATTDPMEFHRAFRALTVDFEAAAQVPASCLAAIRSYLPRHPATPQDSSSLPRRRSSRSRDTFPAFALDHTPHSPDTMADCFVVLSGVVAPISPLQLDRTDSATDVKVVVQITDKLYHPHVKSFRVPDEIATFLYPAPLSVQTAAPPPRWLDTVLTALQGLLVAEGASTIALPPWLDDHATFYLPKCLCFLSRRPTFKTLHLALLQVFRSQHIQSKVISAFLNVPLPTSSQDAKTICVFHDHTFMLHSPQSFPPNEVDFALLFERLSLNNILEKVAVAAKCVAMLTPILETLRALLHPYFVTQVVYIPIVPEHLGDFLCSPVPFLVGLSVDQLHRAQLDSWDDVIFVNLDTNTVHVPPNLPERPKKKFLKALGAFCERATIAVRDDKHHVDDDNAADFVLYGQVDMDDFHHGNIEPMAYDVAWRTEQCLVADHINDMWSGLQELVTTFFRTYVI